MTWKKRALAERHGRAAREVQSEQPRVGDREDADLPALDDRRRSWSSRRWWGKLLAVGILTPLPVTPTTARRTPRPWISNEYVGASGSFVVIVTTALREPTASGSNWIWNRSSRPRQAES